MLMYTFIFEQVLVQPSNRRAYPMASYSNAGARIQESVFQKSSAESYFFLAKKLHKFEGL